MDHQQKAPECASKFVFFAVLRTCMQNRKQADTVNKKGVYYETGTFISK